MKNKLKKAKERNRDKKTNDRGAGKHRRMMKLSNLFWRIHRYNHT